MEETQIVVIGAGASGISAALTAAQAGAKVVLLEKGDKFGGAGKFGAQGLFAADSKAQREVGVKYSKKDAFEEILNYTHHRSNARMTKAIVDESAATIDWMAENGLATELVSNTQEVHQDHPQTYHQFIDKFAGFQRLIDRFEEAGGTLLTETFAEQLVLDDNGALKSVRINEKGGERELACQAVILADGGFVGSQEELEKSISIPYSDLYSMGERKSTGDGLRMLGEIGGVNNYKRMLENHAASVVTDGKNPWSNGSLMTLATIPGFWVDQEGKRFTNEDVVYDFALWGNTTYTAGGYYFFLFDQVFVDYLTSKPLAWTGSFERTMALLAHQPMTYQVGPFEHLQAELDGFAGTDPVWKADSLAQLAQELRIKPSVLQETVAHYNSLVESGHDTDFYKDDKFMKFALTQGPFYAVKAISTTLGTVGGALVNENFEALTQNRRVIPGVYAIGNNASGLFDSAYPTIEGLSNAFAWNSGRIAGRQAAKYVK